MNEHLAAPGARLRQLMAVPPGGGAACPPRPACPGPPLPARLPRPAHPLRPSYAALHGKMLVHPVNGRRIPIIADAELVDMSFGTGELLSRFSFVQSIGRWGSRNFDLVGVSFAPARAALSLRGRVCARCRLRGGELADMSSGTGER